MSSDGSSLLHSGENSNISKVERDADGAIVIDEFNGDLDRLIEEIDSSLKGT